MNDAPRRRRLEPDEPKGGLPIFPLIIVVVLAGLLLGGLISRIYKPGAAPPAPSSVPSITPLPLAQATPTLAPRATIAPSRSPSASPSPSATASATPSPSPKASSTVAPSAAPTRTPTTAPTVIFITPAPKASKAPAVLPSARPSPTPSPVPKPTSTPTPVQITGAANADHAAAIVSAYLGALARGEQSLATGYLMRGLPNESFMSSTARVSGVQATKNADGTYKVTADIATANGEYFETFKVESGPSGLQISDHYAIKVQ